MGYYRAGDPGIFGVKFPWEIPQAVIAPSGGARITDIWSAVFPKLSRVDVGKSAVGTVTTFGKMLGSIFTGGSLNMATGMDKFVKQVDKGVGTIGRLADTVGQVTTQMAPPTANALDQVTTFADPGAPRPKGYSTAEYWEGDDEIELSAGDEDISSVPTADYEAADVLRW